MKLTRKQKRMRAELKRAELFKDAMEYMKSQIQACSVGGNLNLRMWGEVAENYIRKLLKERPQESEMIMQLSRRLEETLTNTVKATIEYIKRRDSEACK